MTGLNCFKSNTMTYEAPSLAIGSVLWVRTGTGTVEREGRLACNSMAEKKLRPLRWLSINFFIQINSQLQSRQWPLGSLGNSVAAVATGKKQNSTGQLPHFIVKRHPLLFLKSFKTLSSIYCNTHTILIIREALTRGALEIPWWFTPNRAIRACAVLQNT